MKLTKAATLALCMIPTALAIQTPPALACAFHDAASEQEQILADCKAIYAQDRFKHLLDKDRAIANCAVARSYYKLTDKK